MYQYVRGAALVVFIGLAQGEGYGKPHSSERQEHRETLAGESRLCNSGYLDCFTKRALATLEHRHDKMHMDDTVLAKGRSPRSMELDDTKLSTDIRCTRCQRGVLSRARRLSVGSRRKWMNAMIHGGRLMTKVEFLGYRTIDKFEIINRDVPANDLMVDDRAASVAFENEQDRVLKAAEREQQRKKEKDEAELWDRLPKRQEYLPFGEEYVGKVQVKVGTKDEISEKGIDESHRTGRSGGFQPGDLVSYYSRSAKGWVPARIVGAHHSEVALVYLVRGQMVGKAIPASSSDLRTSSQFPAPKLKASSSKKRFLDSDYVYSVGEQVQYFSTSNSRWLDAKIKRKNDDGSYNLDIRKFAKPQRLRPILQVVDEDFEPDLALTT